MTRKITTAAVLAAMGIILPVATHQFGGQPVGQMLLPLHLMAMIAGLLLGVSFGVVVALVSVLGSFLVAGMPPVLMLPFFLMQVVVLGFAAGVMRAFAQGEKWRVYAAVVVAQIVGWGLTGLVFMSSVPLIAMIQKGIVGIVLQIAIVPPIVGFLRRRI